MQALAADENQLNDLTGTIAVAEEESLPDIPVCPAFALKDRSERRAGWRFMGTHWRGCACVRRASLLGCG